MTENQRHGPSGPEHRTPNSLRPGLGGWLARWEVLLFLMFVAVLVVNSVLSPYFLDLDNMLFATSNFAEKALIALPMALVIIVRDIDVSVASMTAVAAVAIGLSAESGAGPMSLVAIGIGIGTLAGLINGLIVTRLRIHSIVVTIGTLSLYRGLAVVFIGERALTKFPAGFDYLGQGFVFSVVPFGFVLFLVCALSFGIVLRFTKVGRKIYAIGSGPDAALVSGINVDGYRLALFCLTGAFSGLAAVMLTSRLLSVRLNVATGWELDVITMVVLGGVSISGGSGSVLGVVLAVLFIGYLTYGLSLLNVPAILMSILIGALLIAAIGLPRLIAWLRS